MAVFRVNKTADYTVMSNFHLKDKRLSLKAKGLLSLILSLPDNWSYTIGGLVAICREREAAVKSALGELKKCGYLSVDKIKPSKENGGRYEYIYNIFEQPNEKQGVEKQGIENQPLEFQGIENRALYKSTNISSTNVSNTDLLSTYVVADGSPEENSLNKLEPFRYDNVFLSDKQVEALLQVMDIKVFDAYVDKITKYPNVKNHYETILKWHNEDSKVRC